MESILPAAAALVVILTALATAASRLWRRLRPFLSAWRQLLEDWHGEPGRPGVPPRPGVMARLAELERTAKDVRSEVQHNSGDSMRDAVERIEAAVTDRAA